jgi:hypothetical protein
MPSDTKYNARLPFVDAISMVDCAAGTPKLLRTRVIFESA